MKLWFVYGTLSPEETLVLCAKVELMGFFNSNFNFYWKREHVCSEIGTNPMAKLECKRSFYFE